MRSWLEAQDQTPMEKPRERYRNVSWFIVEAFLKLKEYYDQLIGSRGNNVLILLSIYIYQNMYISLIHLHVLLRCVISSDPNYCKMAISSHLTNTRKWEKRTMVWSFFIANYFPTSGFLVMGSFLPCLHNHHLVNHTLLRLESSV